jgi:hypothetical protein
MLSVTAVSSAAISMVGHAKRAACPIKPVDEQPDSNSDMAIIRAFMMVSVVGVPPKGRVVPLLRGVVVAGYFAVKLSPCSRYQRGSGFNVYCDELCFFGDGPV